MGSRPATRTHTLSRAVRAASLFMAGTASTAVMAQPPTEIITGSQSEILLIDSVYPDGAIIIIEDGAFVDVLATGPNEDAVFDITVNGTVFGNFFSSLSTYGNQIPNASSLTVGADGSIGSVQLDAGASVLNNGEIVSIPNASGTESLDAIQRWNTTETTVQPGGFSLINNGVIRSFGSAAVAVDRVETIDIVNNGLIDVQAPLPGFSLNRDPLSAFELGAIERVQITNSGDITAGLSDANNLVTVFNSFSSGLGTPGLPLNPIGQFTLDNLAGGRIEGQRIFSNFATANNNVAYTGYQLTINNEGQIRAGGLAFGVRGAVDIVNSGSIIVDPDFGAFNGDPSSAVLSHFATPGFFEEEAISLTNTATGVMEAPVVAAFTSGVINNAGIMRVNRLDQFGFGGQAIQIGQFFNTTVPNDPALWVESAEVNNSGSILGATLGISVIDGVSEAIINNSGTISGQIAINNTNGRLNITNESGGVIESTVGGIAINSIQDRTDPGLNFDDTLTTRGTITGDVLLGVGNDTVQANGLIDGRVDLGDGDDTFIAEGGLTVTGGVEGGNGFDTLRLINGSFTPGAGNVNSSFSGFDAAFFEGTFSLSGDGVPSPIVLTAPNITFEPGTIFEVDAFENGTGDQLRNTGSITLNGGTVRAISDDAAWSVSRDYTILIADGGLTGTFDNVTSNLPYLTPSLAYTANSVVLTLGREDGLIQGDILETTNAQQLSVAARVIPRIIQTQTSNSIRRLLEQEESSSSVAAAPFTMATGLSAGDETGATGSAWINLTPTRYDQQAVLPGAQGPQDIDGDAINFLAGVDRVFGSRFVAGAFIGYEDSEVEYRAIGGEQNNEGALVGAYAGFAFNSWLYSSVNANVAYLQNELEERAFDATDVQDADFDSVRYSIGVDITAVGQSGAWNYLGQLAYNYSDETYDSYLTNRGEVVQLEDLSLGRFSLTGEVSYRGELWNPYLSLSYEYDGDVSDTVTDDNGLVVNAGLRAVQSERLTFEAYIATVTSRNNENQELVGLNVNYAF